MGEHRKRTHATASNSTLNDGDRADTENASENGGANRRKSTMNDGGEHRKRTHATESKNTLNDRSDTANALT